MKTARLDLRTLLFGLGGLGIGIFLLASPAARADEPSAAAILKMTDDAHGGFSDLTTDSKMTIREPGQTTGREFQFVTISRGNNKRLVRFTAPGDVKGMGMLVENRDTMYAYLPG